MIDEEFVQNKAIRLLKIARDSRVISPYTGSIYTKVPEDSRELRQQNVSISAKFYQAGVVVIKYYSLFTNSSVLCQNIGDLKIDVRLLEQYLQSRLQNSRINYV